MFFFHVFFVTGATQAFQIRDTSSPGGTSSDEVGGDVSNETSPSLTESIDVGVVRIYIKYIS